MNRNSHRTIKKSGRAAPTSRDSRPFVLSNFAMTADGKIAFADKNFTPFTSRRDHEHMMELRATVDAVLSGARTVELSNATLSPGGVKYQRQRVRRGLSEFNLRIIVSGSGSINPNAEIFRHRFSPIIILTTRRASKARLKRLREVAEVKICGESEINFRRAVQWLKHKWGVNRLLCEGGGEIHDALLRAGLVNEIHLTISPKIFGGRTAPTLADGIGFTKLADAVKFELHTARRVSDEIFLVYRAVSRHAITGSGRSGRSLSKQRRTVRANKRG